MAFSTRPRRGGPGSGRREDAPAGLGDLDAGNRVIHETGMHDPVEGAKRYIERSNAGDLERIRECFADAVIYRSNRVGAYEGLGAVQQMMRGFYGRYRNPRWMVADYRLVESDTVEFAFTMTGTSANGDAVERRGVERLRFCPESGLIVEVEVDVR